LIRARNTRRLEDGDKATGLKIGGAFDPDANEAERDQKHPDLLDMLVERYYRKEKAQKKRRPIRQHLPAAGPRGRQTRADAAWGFARSSTHWPLIH